MSSCLNRGLVFEERNKTMNVSKEMVDALRMARWREWEQRATEMPKGQHILSVELLRVGANQTAVVLTIARNGKVAQYELREIGRASCRERV